MYADRVLKEESVASLYGWNLIAKPLVVSLFSTEKVFSLKFPNYNNHTAIQKTFPDFIHQIHNMHVHTFTMITEQWTWVSIQEGWMKFISMYGNGGIFLMIKMVAFDFSFSPSSVSQYYNILPAFQSEREEKKEDIRAWKLKWKLKKAKKKDTEGRTLPHSHVWIYRSSFLASYLASWMCGREKQ